ncbi:hypothetical protein F5Y17DRAFT_420642 [Xylariaceae sp. FL0594]|nr:hypothetical protein F5Y17DRAFT_420642 [Xylariaceae sp. FL0594]
MRLVWYAGASTALATGVVAYAFNQRANFYSAMVYLSQNNLNLLILVNLVLLVYSSFVWGLQRLCYGPLRPVEIEQLYEKAWFAVTETCLAMTIFREEIGGWFLVMFTALVTGKVWEWIGEGRVEVLEQQPPANPRLFHTRLSVSLAVSIIYDTWLFIYAVRTVIQQARPNMMVMFLFEFAVLTTCSLRTVLRYGLSLVESRIVKQQTQSRLAEQRRLVRERRNDVLRRRESDDPAEAEAAQQEELPDEGDIDELDIEVPGWESKGHWVLSLDLMTDLMKLGIYTAFFGVVTAFYGLPIHIMRDLFMTARSFVKRLGALLRYRKALSDINRYPDATQEDLAREDTCIICREEMRPWDPASPGAVERSRPKKLPCGHILHYGCLKGWLERQQVCPTCRSPVVVDNPTPGAAAGGGAGIGAGAGAGAAQGGNGWGQPAAPAPILPNGGGGPNAPQPGQPHPNLRVYRLGPLQLGFAQGGDPHEMINRMRQPPLGPAALPTPTATLPPATPAESLDNIGNMQVQLNDISNRIQQEINALYATQAEVQTLYGLTLELNRMRRRQLQDQTGVANRVVPGGALPPQHSLPTQHFAHVPAHVAAHMSAVHAHHPAVTRHGGAQYTSAIPSGSPDLPEGLTIPAGWSLLPLQRLDNQQSSLPGEAQASSAGPSQGVQNHQHETNETAVTRNDDAARDPVVTSSPDPAPSSTQASANSPSRADSETLESPSFPRLGENRSGDVAPTPTIPQWTRFSPIPFSSPGESSAAPVSGVGNDVRSEDTSGNGSVTSASGAKLDADSDPSSSKGKGKAVTFEEVEDDGSD